MTRPWGYCGSLGAGGSNQAPVLMGAHMKLMREDQAIMLVQAYSVQRGYKPIRVCLIDFCIFRIDHFPRLIMK